MVCAPALVPSLIENVATLAPWVAALHDLPQTLLSSLAVDRLIDGKDLNGDKAISLSHYLL